MAPASAAPLPPTQTIAQKETEQRTFRFKVRFHITPEIIDSIAESGVWVELTGEVQQNWTVEILYGIIGVWKQSQMFNKRMNVKENALSR